MALAVRSSGDQCTRTTVVPGRVMRSVIWAGVVLVTVFRIRQGPALTTAAEASPAVTITPAAVR